MLSSGFLEIIFFNTNPPLLRWFGLLLAAAYSWSFFRGLL
jgi:hypothetical protein